jgi:hypothetical protein
MKQLAQTEMTGHNRDRVMSNEINSGSEKAQPLVYQIRIKGHLGCEWTDWFGGLTLTLEDNGETLLTGPVVDQAALHGLLRKVRDLGVPLLSVNRVKPGEAEASEVNETHHSRSKKGDTHESDCQHTLRTTRCS